MQRSKTVALWLATAAAGLVMSGCATQEYVDEQIAGVNGRIDTLNGQVTSLSGKVDANSAGVQAAQARADEAYKLAQGSLTRTVISETDKVNFDTNKWELSSEAKATLTAFAERLKGENKNVYIEIVGRGDPRGKVYDNRVLGEKRALEVRRFLLSQGIPLSHMNTVSWGEEKPVEGDDASNRVVLLRVTSA